MKFAVKLSLLAIAVFLVIIGLARLAEHLFKD